MRTAEYIHEIIGDIVDGLRITGTISNVTLNVDGNYVMSATNSFSAKDVLTITNTNNETFSNVIVLSATTTELIT
jgi:VCBS repeat-containing protein